MKIPALFKEYIWLVNTIYRARRISLIELNDKWVETDMSGGVEMARTTFNRHKDAIQDIFGIYIECDRKDGYRYYIGNPKVLEDDTVQNWMLSILSLSNVISESVSLQDRIIAEHVSVDARLLEQLTGAMKSGHRINIRYRRYGSPQSYWTGADPYCLKLFHQQWYLLGKLFGNKYEMFALNMMEEITVQDRKYKIAKDFDAVDFFEPYFGVVIDEGMPTEKIVIRAYGDERYELRDVPLHKSQIFKSWQDRTRLVDNPENYRDYDDIEVKLKPTSDFIDYLLSKTGRLQVLSPQSVIDKVNDRMRKATMMYNDKKTNDND